MLQLIYMDSLKYHDNEVRKVPGPSPESSYLIDHPTSKAHSSWTGPTTGFDGSSFIIVYTIIKWSHRIQSGRANCSPYGSIRQFVNLLTLVLAQGLTISIIHASVFLRWFFYFDFSGVSHLFRWFEWSGWPCSMMFFLHFNYCSIHNFILPGFIFLAVVLPIWFYGAVSIIR